MPRFLGLTTALAVREWQSRYRRSVLGPCWAVIPPFFYIIAFTFLRTMMGVQTSGREYALFAACALVPWTFFGAAVQRMGQSVISNAAILRKCPLQHEAFLVAALAISCIDFAITLAVLVAGLCVVGIWVDVTICWLAFPMVLMLALSMGIGFFMAGLGSYRRDILMAFNFILQFWLLATPILYKLGDVPERWRGLYALNPMVGIIEAFRSILLTHTMPDFWLLAQGLPVTCALIAVGWPLFRYMGRYFADVL